MSEPRAVARQVNEVAPGILHWGVRDERIDFRSDAYAIVERSGTVLIDPLPLIDEELDRLGSVRDICITGSCHQRSAWRYRRRFGARVHAPAGAMDLDETPDVVYRHDYRLPGGLIARHSPGPTHVHYSLVRADGGGTLFCADILVNDCGNAVRFVPDEYQDDPERTAQTAEQFLELTFSTLCFAHGAPFTRGARVAIRGLLRERSEIRRRGKSK
jgi:hypothetical protein